MRSPARGPHAGTMRRSLAMLLTCFSIVFCIAAMRVAAQSGPRAEANQLHAAIVNGDVESLRYWLTDRHTDASAANAAEPDISPLGRCVGLAARTLDASPASEREPSGTPSPVVSLRTLQAMVTLLYQHGARLTDAERRRFSGPAIRWYDDTVSTPPEPTSAPPSQTAVTPPPTGRSSKPGITLGLATVVIRTDPREPCNGVGHTVYLVNETQLSIRASITMYEDAAGTVNGSRKSDSYAVDPDSAWRLGCNASIDGRSVRYELNAWR